VLVWLSYQSRNLSDVCCAIEYSSTLHYTVASGFMRRSWCECNYHADRKKTTAVPRLPLSHCRRRHSISVGATGNDQTCDDLPRSSRARARAKLEQSTLRWQS
jgi:hypothetical protein